MARILGSRTCLSLSFAKLLLGELVLAAFASRLKVCAKYLHPSGYRGNLFFLLNGFFLLSTFVPSRSFAF